MLKPRVPTTSSRCATNACVEVTLSGPADRVTVRDSKPEGGVVDFTPDAWRLFVAHIVRT